ncbi:MAG: hypothetical protein HY369_04520 [Candidatus Aenigmarchaeota archaeon]|nr:hypothetical protein [Candidatus Aenigmarchaeota archaeon]
MRVGDIPSSAAAGVVLVFFIGTVTIFSAAHLYQVTSELKDADERIGAIDMAHLVRWCLGDAPDVQFLESQKGKEFSALEGLPEACKRDVHVRIREVAGDRAWEFGEQQDVSYTLFVPLSDGQEVIMGDLYVSIDT